MMVKKENILKFNEEMEECFIGVDTKELATHMHDEYERMAKVVGWNTQDKCKVPFDKLPEANQKVMYGVAFSVIQWFSKKLNEPSK